MEQSDAIWNYVLEVGTPANILNDRRIMMHFEVGTAEKMLKARTLNCAFWRNLKRCFGSVEKNKDAKRCIVTLFETMFQFSD